MAADSGMDTCPSPEIADSRKRPLDGEDENGDTKRSHFSNNSGAVLRIASRYPSVCRFFFATTSWAFSTLLNDKQSGHVPR
ncbi:hypothetical protein QE152_g29292 [Popillia japonica]|uniref:Uncharacterized protein n=1 Tax=Popillia japonica TaxID=7064 RepID=A0AAW1JIB3_POPJA